MSKVCDISSLMLSKMKQKKVVTCEYVITPTGFMELEKPTDSDEYICTFCGSSNHHVTLVDPAKSDKRALLCVNSLCDVYTKTTNVGCNNVNPPTVNATLWPLFCEMNDIGDIHHGVTFDKINQDRERLNAFHKFTATPTGIMLMQGISGSGKTYASMGICELYTRSNTSAIFSTQKKMQTDWMYLEQQREYTHRITHCSLLVVDDFGTGDIPPGFMTFFMDLIDKRTQWTDRGTIITTNLGNQDLIKYCGHALSDRIKPGQKFIFKEKSRR